MRDKLLVYRPRLLRGLRRLWWINQGVLSLHGVLIRSKIPWCRLLSQYAQNSNVSICTSNFTIGGSRKTNLALKDQTICAILCAIKHTQTEMGSVDGSNRWFFGV